MNFLTANIKYDMGYKEYKELNSKFYAIRGIRRIIFTKLS